MLFLSRFLSSRYFVPVQLQSCKGHVPTTNKISSDEDEVDDCSINIDPSFDKSKYCLSKFIRSYFGITQCGVTRRVFNRTTNVSTAVPNPSSLIGSANNNRASSPKFANTMVIPLYSSPSRLILVAFFHIVKNMLVQWHRA